MSSKRAIRRRFQRRGCKGKVQHWTHGQAQNARHNMKGDAVNELHIYACQSCGAYHLGHKPKRLIKQERKEKSRRMLPTKPIDWFGEWKDQRERFAVEAEIVALRALSLMWEDESAAREIYQNSLLFF